MRHERVNGDELEGAGGHLPKSAEPMTETVPGIPERPIRGNPERAVAASLVTFWSQKIQHRTKFGNISQHKRMPNIGLDLVFSGFGNTKQYVP